MHSHRPPRTPSNENRATPSSINSQPWQAEVAVTRRSFTNAVFAKLIKRQFIRKSVVSHFLFVFLLPCPHCAVWAPAHADENFADAVSRRYRVGALRSFAPYTHTRLCRTWLFGEGKAPIQQNRNHDERQGCLCTPYAADRGWLGETEGRGVYSDTCGHVYSLAQ